MTADELDQLLLDRFNLRRADLISALKTLPAHRPWAATLTAEEARLFDEAGFIDLCRPRHRSIYTDPGTMPRRRWGGGERAGSGWLIRSGGTEVSA
jgi:hypothetical protein